MTTRRMSILSILLIVFLLFAAACQPTAELEPMAAGTDILQEDPTATPESDTDESSSESEAEAESESESEEVGETDSEEAEASDADEASSEEGDDAAQDDGEEGEEEESPFINADEGGLVRITGLLTYTNPFFGSGTTQPLILLEDQAGFVDRDTNYIFPLESQVLGQITSDFKQSPFSYSMVLPIEPSGGYRDVDNDEVEETGVQIFAVAYWDNTYGGPFLEERDLAGGGWSTGYVSTILSTELETEREIIGGKIIVYAPDDEQSFPVDFGEDGLLFSEDDANMIDLPAGYTVVDLDRSPFTFDRSRNQEIGLLESEASELRDFSDLSYTDALSGMIEEMKERYAFSDVKDVDWDALEEEFMPRFEEAEENADPLAYRRALRDLLWRVPDGHVSGPTVISDFREAIAVGVGMGIRDVDDGRIVVSYLSDGGPAQAAGLELGTEIVAIDGVTATVAVDNAIAYSAPFSTDHNRRLQKLRYAIRFPATTVEVDVDIVNADGEIETVTLPTSNEVDSFNHSSFFAGRTGIELPVEFELLDSGYGYVKITGFLDNQLLTIQLWERMIQQLNDQQIPGLIIDMRQNGGGFGWTALQMSAYFFQEPQIAGNTAQYDEELGEFIIKEENAREMILPDPTLRYDGDIAVLVGPACASACEFFSYYMTLEDRAEIVGQYPTAGLGGSVTELRMPEGEQIRYTIGRAVDASGEIHIEGKGVEPTVVVPVTEETLFTDEDVILDAAVSALDNVLAFDPEIAGELVLGDVVTGSLESGETDFYAVTLSEGDIVNILAESDDVKTLDPIVRIYAEDGTLLIENDDLSTRTLNAGFEELEIPFDILIFVEVAAVEDGNGGYTLIIEPTVGENDATTNDGATDSDSEEGATDEDSEDAGTEEGSGEGDTEEGGTEEGSEEGGTEEGGSEEGDSEEGSDGDG